MGRAGYILELWVTIRTGKSRGDLTGNSRGEVVAPELPIYKGIIPHVKDRIKPRELRNRRNDPAYALRGSSYLGWTSAE